MRQSTQQAVGDDVSLLAPGWDRAGSFYPLGLLLTPPEDH
jgi:hypothetical protein